MARARWISRSPKGLLSDTPPHSDSARMPLRHLWAGCPCQMADLELNPNLNIHENGSNHGQTPDLHLNIHEIGSIHGQTPIRTSQSKPQFDDFYYIGENRAFRRECHIRCTESSARRHTSGDCCKMHRTSGRGGQSLARELLKRSFRPRWWKPRRRRSDTEADNV